MDHKRKQKNPCSTTNITKCWQCCVGRTLNRNCICVLVESFFFLLLLFSATSLVVGFIYSCCFFSQFLLLFSVLVVSRRLPIDPLSIAFLLYFVSHLFCSDRNIISSNASIDKAHAMYIDFIVFIEVFFGLIFFFFCYVFFSQFSNKIYRSFIVFHFFHSSHVHRPIFNWIV